MGVNEWLGVLFLGWGSWLDGCGGRMGKNCGFLGGGLCEGGRDLWSFMICGGE